jgi:hypothetical protein
MKRQSKSELAQSLNLKQVLQPSAGMEFAWEYFRARVAEVIPRAKLGQENQFHFERFLAAQVDAKKFSREPSPYESLRIEKMARGQTFVRSGQLTSPLAFNPSFNYSHVPLGFILQGRISVVKGGKATKTLHPGDFVGLFETADWLVHGQNREIGDWNLVAHGDSEIMFFSDSVLSSPSENVSSFVGYLTEIARHDSVPQPLSKLPILDWIAAHTTSARLHVIRATIKKMPKNVA